MYAGPLLSRLESLSTVALSWLDDANTFNYLDNSPTSPTFFQPGLTTVTQLSSSPFFLDLGILVPGLSPEPFICFRGLRTKDKDSCHCLDSWTLRNPGLHPYRILMLSS